MRWWLNRCFAVVDPSKMNPNKKSNYCIWQDYGIKSINPPTNPSTQQYFMVHVTGKLCFFLPRRWSLIFHWAPVPAPPLAHDGGLVFQHYHNHPKWEAKQRHVRVGDGEISPSLREGAIIFIRFFWEGWFFLLEVFVIPYINQGFLLTEKRPVVYPLTMCTIRMLHGYLAEAGIFLEAWYSRWHLRVYVIRCFCMMFVFVVKSFSMYPEYPSILHLMADYPNSLSFITSHFGLTWHFS